MNKILKKILIIVAIIIFLYILFIVVECFRFTQFLCSEPLIKISKIEEENRIIYYGIGYSILYKYNIHEYSNDNIGKEIYSGEFRVFNIPILHWIT